MRIRRITKFACRVVNRERPRTRPKRAVDNSSMRMCECGKGFSIIAAHQNKPAKFADIVARNDIEHTNYVHQEYMLFGGAYAESCEAIIL